MTVRVGVLGAGTVGGALVNRLLADRDAIRLKSGVDLEVRRVAVRDLSKKRPFDIKDGLADRRCGVGGDRSLHRRDRGGDRRPRTGRRIGPGRAAVRKAHVTANKQLIATRGHEITEAAKRAGVTVMYEARSVAGSR